VLEHIFESKDETGLVIVSASKNWYKLAIDVTHALKDVQQIFALAESKFFQKLNGAMWTFENNEVKDYFTDEWIGYMRSLGLELDMAFVFCRKPGAQPPAHVDCLSNTKDIYSIAINWVLNDNDESYQVWYRSLEDEEPPMWTTGHYKGHYQINYQNIDKLIEIDRCYIKQTPVMVRTNIPHNIMHTGLRWSISVRFKIPAYVPKDGKDLTWEEQVAIMKPFIVDTI
jgi:hypothetical protein